VQFARRAAEGVEIRIWERGAGETLASGSSSCAVAAAAVARGRVRPGRVAVAMPGGTLQVDVTAELDLTLTGPVAPVGWCVLDPRWSPGS
jgi:diaminopimelate epimerase